MAHPLFDLQAFESGGFAPAQISGHFVAFVILAFVFLCFPYHVCRPVFCVVSKALQPLPTCIIIFTGFPNGLSFPLHVPFVPLSPATTSRLGCIALFRSVPFPRMPAAPAAADFLPAPNGRRSTRSGARVSMCQSHEVFVARPSQATGVFGRASPCVWAVSRAGCRWKVPLQGRPPACYVRAFVAQQCTAPPQQFFCVCCALFRLLSPRALSAHGAAVHGRPPRLKCTNRAASTVTAAHSFQQIGVFLFACYSHAGRLPRSSLLDPPTRATH